ncbi:ATP-binding protein [Rubrivivax albus]|uniref:histidine kinase n=1 Tax=Rubrivivax albus TaxID=2499835 RepID=A0A3S2TM64_9BURK|nr:ATP-binding protein [Rubrivivax albus]RVT51508.1 two-component sensor histidine kinase [Rubrivivax albus]
MSTPSLSRRLLVLVMALVGLTWIGAAVYTWIDVRHELDELFDGHLAQAAALLVVQAADFHEDDDDEVPESPVLHRYAPRVAFQVFHEDRLVRRSANAPVQPMVAAGARTDHGFARVRISGEPWRVFVARGAEQDVRVYVGEHEHARGAVLRAVLRGTLWPLALALPVLALAVAWGVHGGLAPLRRLGRTLAARVPGDVSPVGTPDAPAEMRPMLDALDGLFTRIATLIDGERRFTADAAHELRTPIAAIRAQAQVVLGAQDDAERRHALQSVLAGCDRATRLVAQLLALARVESTAAARADGTPTDLAALARRTVADLAPAALARQQTLGLESPAACPVPADETLLGVLLRNLVDNALRYSPPGAEVRVSVAAGGTLTVEDGGPGLDADARVHLGQRFYRADTAAASGAAGSGLGWSIVRRIAERERLLVDVDTSPALGGLRVRVTPRQNS